MTLYLDAHSHLQCYLTLCGSPFPQDPGQQLRNADEARRRTATLQAEDGQPLALDGHAGAIYTGTAHTEVETPTELLDRLAMLR